MRNLIILLCLASPMTFAESWSGILVDSTCYEYQQNNVDPTNTSPASRPMNSALQSCYPTEKTKSFAVVQENWSALKLDAAGNAKAAEFVRSGKKSPLNVTVTGEKEKKEVKVTSLSLQQ